MVFRLLYCDSGVEKVVICTSKNFYHSNNPYITMKGSRSDKYFLRHIYSFPGSLPLYKLHIQSYDLQTDINK